MSQNDRFVVTHPRGWAVKEGGVERPEAVFNTQAEAERAAKQTVGLLGGGEVRVRGRDGRFATRTRSRRPAIRSRRATRSTLEAGAASAPARRKAQASS
jgi:hypothetical protein